MAREDLYWRLVHAADVAESETDKELLNDAAFEISQLSDKVEELMESRNCVTVSVTLSADRIRDMMNEAFVNVTGKDLEYVAQAVTEKMERDGEVVGEAEEKEEV